MNQRLVSRLPLLTLFLLVCGPAACDTQQPEDQQLHENPSFPSGDTLELRRIASQSPQAARTFPDSLLSGELPHIFNGGYGHIGVGQPIRSFWNVLESGQIRFVESATTNSTGEGQYHLVLSYATFTDGVPYDDARLSQRCTWTNTGQYVVEGDQLMLIDEADALRGAISKQARMVAFDTLKIEGCREWAYYGTPFRWTARDARFSQDEGS